MKKSLLLSLLLSLIIHTHAQTTISIMADSSVLDTSITAITIADVQGLLGQACSCKVSVNDPSASVQIKLPNISRDYASEPNRFAEKAKFPYRNYPRHDYYWNIRRDGDRRIYELSTLSWQGVSFALYGLLQERLGFRFYHPRRTVIPDFKGGWPTEQYKKGFHLHTQHPLELTEQLLDPTVPHALDDVKQYIDWLVRNGQTYFEFCLLNDIDRDAWPAHAKAFVDYAHSRGLLIGADLSLHMIQQKTFQLYKGPGNKQKQIERNLTWLLQADWDYFNMEQSTSEFISGNMKKKEELRQFVLAYLRDHSHTSLTGRQHVVKHENELGGEKKTFEWDSASLALDKRRGVEAHTVMCYDMTEPNAPVYQNKNQRHQFEFLLKEMKERETWYYPESAYWVTFDNSIPMLLLPYLSARLKDIDTCVAYGVPGHLTFSSGWEWGYWLIDWSIARWSWQYSYNGFPQKREPTMYTRDLTTWQNESRIHAAMELQQHYLKDSSLMQWMTAMTITDEIGIKALNKEYEPRPQWSYKYLENKANDSVISAVRKEVLPKLKAFAERTFAVVDRFPPDQDSIKDEMVDGIMITGFRALHRYYTLRYILDRRVAKLNHLSFDGDSLLYRAERIRTQQAQQMVNDRQKHYRYPLESIAGEHWDHTAYHFGYLYQARSLHFWKREEEQARRNKYSPWFMNVWNVGRIAGFIK